MNVQQEMVRFKINFVYFCLKWEKLCYTEFQEDRNKHRINGDKSKID